VDYLFLLGFFSSKSETENSTSLLMRKRSTKQMGGGYEFHIQALLLVELHTTEYLHLLRTENTTWCEENARVNVCTSRFSLLAFDWVNNISAVALFHVDAKRNDKHMQPYEITVTIHNYIYAHAVSPALF
jgi:hypothetical protein